MYIRYVLMSLIFCSFLFSQKAKEDIPQWPREFQGKNASVIVYQPQAKNWKKQTLRATAAIAVLQGKEAEPIYGAIDITAKTHTDMDNRMVTLYNLQVVAANFATAKNPQQLEITVQKIIPREPRQISLDLMLSMLAATKQQQKKEERAARALKNSVPPIFFSYQPALLVFIDGETILRPIADSGLMSVVNTRWNIVLDAKTSNYYLLYKDCCLVALDIKGPWKLANKVPSTCSRIPAKHPRVEFRQFVGKFTGNTNTNKTNRNTNRFRNTNRESLFQQLNRDRRSRNRGTRRTKNYRGWKSGNRSRRRR